MQEPTKKTEKTEVLQSLNEETLAELSIEELEDRLEMQILCAMPTPSAPGPTYQAITYQR